MFHAYLQHTCKNKICLQFHCFSQVFSKAISMQKFERNSFSRSVIVIDSKYRL